MIEIGLIDTIARPMPEGWGELARLFLLYLGFIAIVQAQSWLMKRREGRRGYIWIAAESLLFTALVYAFFSSQWHWGMHGYWIVLIPGLHFLMEWGKRSEAEAFRKADKDYENALEADREKALKSEEKKEFDRRYKRRAAWVAGDVVLDVLTLTLLWYSMKNGETQAMAESFEFLQYQEFWLIVAAYFFVTLPAGYIMKLITLPWQKQLPKDNPGLTNAGKWIGVVERILVLTFIIIGSIGNVGWLISAKSILRFGEIRDANNRKGAEYILIGTLLSFSIAIIVGIWLYAAIGGWLQDFLQQGG